MMMMMLRLKRSGLRKRIVGQVWQRFGIFLVSDCASQALYSDIDWTVRVRAGNAKGS